MSDEATLLKAKLQGEELARPEPVPDMPVIDLMEALRRSVTEAQKRKAAAGRAGRRARATKRAPARRESGAG